MQQTYRMLSDTTIDSKGIAVSPAVNAKLWDFSQGGIFQYDLNSSTTGVFAICSVGLMVSVSDSGAFFYAKGTGYTADPFIGHVACTGAYALSAGGVVQFPMKTMGPYVKLFVKSITDTTVILDNLWLTVSEER